MTPTAPQSDCAETVDLPTAFAYIDRIELLSDREAHPALAKQMRTLCRGKVWPRTCTRCIHFKTRWHICQPTHGFFNEARSLFPNALVSKVEYAFDFLESEHHDSDEMAHFLRAHLIQRYKPAGTTRVFLGTSYYRGRDAPRNIAIYSDKPSNINGGPCAHLEVRLRREALKRLGISRAWEALDVDPRILLNNVATLQRVDLKMLGRQFRGRSRAKLPDLATFNGAVFADRDFRTGLAIATNATSAHSDFHDGRGEGFYPFPDIAAQAVVDCLRHEPEFNSRAALRPMGPISVAGGLRFPRLK